MGSQLGKGEIDGEEGTTEERKTGRTTAKTKMEGGREGAREVGSEGERGGASERRGVRVQKQDKGGPLPPFHRSFHRSIVLSPFYLAKRVPITRNGESVHREMGRLHLRRIRSLRAEWHDMRSRLQGATPATGNIARGTAQPRTQGRVAPFIGGAAANAMPILHAPLSVLGERQWGPGPGLGMETDMERDTPRRPSFCLQGGDQRSSRARMSRMPSHSNPTHLRDPLHNPKIM